MANADAGTPAPKGFLTANIVHFARVLRRAGLPVGPAHVLDAVTAMEAAGVSSREDVYWTLHAVFVSKRDQHVVFDAAFELFWRSRGLVEKMMSVLSPVAPPKLPKPAKAGDSRVADALFGAGLEPKPVEAPVLDIEARLTASEREILQAKDFAQMTAAEIAAAMKAVRAMVMPLDKVATRRTKADPRGPAVDMRRTLRRMLRDGGQGGRLIRMSRRKVHPPVVALLDISGSMTEYSRIFLHFLHALAGRRRVTTFLFGTRLSNVTRAMVRKDPDVALEQVAGSVQDWAGGTRIGESLASFNRLWSRRVMAGGPVVLLITDGLERDGVEELGFAIDRLHRSCRRLIWLNPLLRYDGFEPRAAGVKAMLPHVDEFRAVHSLEKIADLVKALGA